MPAVRPDPLAKLGRTGKAHSARARAAAFARNARERTPLLERADASGREAARPTTAWGKSAHKPFLYEFSQMSTHTSDPGGGRNSLAPVFPLR
jgi:hypothetical protein